MSFSVLIIALLLIGLTLVVVELHVPGHFICGSLGLICVAAAVIITGLSPFGLILVLAELTSLAIVSFILVRYVKRKQLYGRLILNETLEFDENNMGDVRFFVGKEGVSLTPLRPLGTADFNGTRLEVYADGFIERGVRVKVFDATKSRITVRAVSESTEN